MNFNECKICGSKFIKKIYNQIYCSRKCAKISNVKKPKVLKKCSVCDKEYLVYPYRIYSKYCSYACAGKSRRTMIQKKCLNCGSSFMFKPSQINYYKGAGKYCSRKCSYLGTIESNRNKPIMDKYQRSSRKDDKVWKEKIREIGGLICKRCGKYDKYIHTHHVKPRSRFPELKRDIKNGICLCNSCHTWVHQNPKKSTEDGFLYVFKWIK